MAISNMISEERITGLIDNINLFVSSNSTYHFILVASTIFLLAYGLPFFMDDILRDD